jgi:hypothetical protein
MNDAILVSSRKGLFRLGRKNGRWDIEQVDFLGDNVTLTLTDPRSGRLYAALDHGHFGVKMHRSTPTGEEIAAPPAAKPEGLEENDMGSSAGVEHGAHLGAAGGRADGRASSGAAPCRGPVSLER